MRVLIFAFVFSFSAPASEYPYLSSPSGEFMGEVTTDHWRPDAISNELGRYGSTLSPDSVHNEMGRYGSEFSSESPYYIGRPGSLDRHKKDKSLRKY